MTIDFSKPLQTKNGCKVRIVCTDRQNNIGTPIVGLIYDPIDDIEFTAYFTINGIHHSKREYNLMNVPQKKKGWINVYKFKIDVDWAAACSNIYISKEIAYAKRDKSKEQEYIATVEVNWEE